MTRCVHVQCSYTRNGLINNMAQATICMDVQCSYTDTQRINGLLSGFLLRWMFVPCIHTLSLSPSGEELVCCVEWTDETTA